MKKMVILLVTAIIFGVCFFGLKLTPQAAVIFDDEAFEEEIEEASEVAEEITSETPAEEPEIEVFIDVEDPEIEEESDVPVQEENKKGLIPEDEIPESVEEQEETKAKGLIPEESAGEVKGNVVVPTSDAEVIEVKHEGVKPMDTNVTESGETAFCIEEQEQHPDFSGTEYVKVENPEDIHKYDGIAVGYTEAIQRGEKKELCDRAAQSAIWDLNGSQDDQEQLLKDSHKGQDQEDVVRLYNEFKNRYAADHSTWKVTYTTLAPTETSEFGNFQNLITFTAVEEKDEKPEIPEKEVPEIPEETPEFYPLEEDVPETGDNQLPILPFAVAGFVAALAIVGVTCKRNAR